ncbi:sortase [Patescibacteria group bacterium]|nr:sortase [Patescibacteria group bacterium]MBU4210293.1 sortase [Patescibacteria group bacterium]MBU4264483.1 sortase [Patescibacteria group bacterium]MBU4390414.1 sortase [Patescibacteria group bacterium]MBU4396729.1 sortase [Patescibacteria group bacterium]
MLLAISFFIFGSLLLFSVIFPILNFQLKYSSRFNPISSPLSAKFYNKSSSILGEVNTDYTQLNNWFTKNSNSKDIDSAPEHGNPSSYELSIPILKIENANVVVGGTDLKKSLIQYPQTALPGQIGNAVIFGHSVLPQFFNPKSYVTIFSTLFKLKQGDEIYATFDNIKYKYLVEEMFEILPTDLSILEQRFDGRYLTIVTCSPPGTYIRRLIIKAKIVDI